MAEKYLIISSVNEGKTILDAAGIDGRELIGTVSSRLIKRVDFCKTISGDYIIEIPGSLQSVIDSISSGPNANKLKTFEQARALMVEAYLPNQG